MIPSQFQPLANHLWQSSLFTLAVWLLTLVLRKNRAAVRHGLWLAASVKFLAPLALLAAVGSSVGSRKVPVVVRPQAAFVMEEISQPFAQRVLPPPVAIAPRAESRVPAVVYCLWLCGFAANLLAWWRGWRRMRAALRSASASDLKLPIPVLSSPARFEPGVFGVFRPLLLLPEGIAQRLTPAQFEAVVAHELCHVRRRDNLTAAIHMVVEALFWFHPLVWWIERRLVEERERACDEEVLQMATDPQDYAEGIVNVCKFYLESPLVCVSGVTGADLKRRVEAIMINRAAAKLTFTKKLALAAAGVSAVAGPLMVGIFNAPHVQAQSPAPATVQIVAQVPAPSAALPRFGSVSIKRVDPGRKGPWIFPHITDAQRFEAVGAVDQLIQWAYGLGRDFQVSGGPGWLGAPYFDSAGVRIWPAFEQFEIHAMAGRPSSEAEMRQMVQTLLADRFRLKLHRETREVPIYAILVGPDGPKLGPEEEPLDCGPWGGECGFPNIGGQLITARHATMVGFASLLTNNVDRPVIDKTGLTAGYSFDLPYEHSGPGWRTGPSAAIDAVQTLGLRLEPQTETMEILVIDSADRPSEN